MEDKKFDVEYIVKKKDYEVVTPLPSTKKQDYFLLNEKICNIRDDTALCQARVIIIVTSLIAGFFCNSLDLSIFVYYFFFISLSSLLNLISLITQQCNQINKNFFSKTVPFFVIAFYFYFFKSNSQFQSQGGSELRKFFYRCIPCKNFVVLDFASSLFSTFSSIYPSHYLKFVFNFILNLFFNFILNLVLNLSLPLCSTLSSTLSKTSSRKLSSTYSSILISTLSFSSSSSLFSSLSSTFFFFDYVSVVSIFRIFFHGYFL